ncbi:MAG: DUF554 domain-containing protein [Clostridia bacterium]|nr:DUF554 domain-containing protein [Clostridia bacterium]MBQ6867653.1 DUF554 domain-containing protein [Clostridia bacterium]
MIGTITNCCTILTGSFIGSRLKNGLPDKFKSTMMTCMGLAATVLGINSVANNMPNSTMPVLFIISLAIGGLLGQWIDIDSKFQKLTNKFGKEGLAQGLSTAVLLFCIGTLSILGPIESALNNNHTYLFTNATLDLVTSMVLAATFGFGIALSAIVLFCWQGSIYLLAGIIAPYVTPELMCEISIIGGILIFSSGLSILEIKKINTINLLPALIVPPIFFVVKSLIGF